MEADVTRSIEEQLSAFLDGELLDEELQLLVRRLERDEAYRATLVRYSLIGNILRNDPVQSSSELFRGRIMTAIASEGEVAGYQTAATSRGSAWVRPLLAAAVIAMVFAGLLNRDIFDGAIQSDSASLAVFSEPANDTNANASGFDATIRQEPRTGRKASINRERMTSYLVSHGEYARSFQGPMADSRIFVQQASFEQ